MNIAARIALTATLILGMALIVAGTLGTFPRAEWVVFAGLGLFVLAGLPALNALIFRPVVERKRMPNSLAVLSSAAILAVYAAGYERTSDAAQGFARQAAAPRRRAAPLSVPPSVPVAAPLAASAVRGQVPIPVLDSAVIASGGGPETASAAIGRESEAKVPDSATVGQAGSGTAVTAAIEDESFLSVNNTPVPVLPPAPTPAAAPVAAAAPTAQAAVQAAPPQVWEYNDGAYYGKGISRHGDLYVQVIIAAGRIVSANIYKCETQYPCSVIKTVPPQIVSRQDPDRIDNVSGATDSVDAYYWAVAAALDQAVK